MVSKACSLRFARHVQAPPAMRSWMLTVAASSPLPLPLLPWLLPWLLP